jgi:hypothetical protein
MLDLNHLPKTGNGNIDYFYNTGGTAATFSWQTWEKPKGIGTIVITCIGAGGGGASGWCVDGSVSRNSGGGGGSGGFTRVIIPAIVLPDVLYVSVGKGGAGGASAKVAATGNIGSNGSASFVSIAPSSNAIYLTCLANGGGGSSTQLAASSVAGVGAAVATQVNCLMSGLGQFFALAGQDGTAGGQSSGASVIYPTTGLLLSGGAAGGGMNSTNVVRFGGSVTAPTYSSFPLVPTRTGGVVTGNFIGDPGADGITLLQPLMSIGGAGGCSNSLTTSNSCTGGNGGNGGLGSGGGGAGGGPTVSGTGTGGSGGDGLVIIQTF